MKDHINRKKAILRQRKKRKAEKSPIMEDNDALIEVSENRSPMKQVTSENSEGFAEQFPENIMFPSKMRCVS